MTASLSIPGLWVHFRTSLLFEQVSLRCIQSITFQNGLCSGGHGLSIGSVGGRTDNTVDTVTFYNSVIQNSVNGLRVKASVGDTGKINKVTYSKITLKNISK